MPGGDRTGPLGQGPMTGRGFGYCSGSAQPGFTSPGYGRGLGRGWGRGTGRGFWGRGRGYRWRTYYNNPVNPQPLSYTDNVPQVNKEQEKQYLENIVNQLENEMKSVKARIEEISKEK